MFGSYLVNDGSTDACVFVPTNVERLQGSKEPAVDLLERYDVRQKLVQDPRVKHLLARLLSTFQEQ
jgi:hypothetical protein